MSICQEPHYHFQASGNPGEHPQNFNMFALDLQVTPAVLDNLRGKRGVCSGCRKKCGLVCFNCRKNNIAEVCSQNDVSNIS